MRDDSDPLALPYPEGIERCGLSTSPRSNLTPGERTPRLSGLNGLINYSYTLRVNTLRTI